MLSLGMDEEQLERWLDEIEFAPGTDQEEEDQDEQAKEQYSTVTSPPPPVQSLEDTHCQDAVALPIDLNRKDKISKQSAGRPQARVVSTSATSIRSEGRKKRKSDHHVAEASFD